MNHFRQAVSACVSFGLLLAALLACNSEPSAPISVTAEALFNEYQADESAADLKYKGNTVLVTGTVGKVNLTAREVSFVNANKTVLVYAVKFAPDQAAKLGALKSGQQATVKGTCDGRAKLMGMSVNQVGVKDAVIP